MPNLTFHELVHYLNESRDLKNDSDITLDKLKDEQTLLAVDAVLSKNGVTEFYPKRLGGTTALVLELPNQRVLRLVEVSAEPAVDKNEWRRIQPLTELGQASGIQIEIFPKVLTLAKATEQGIVSQQEAADMMKRMVASFARDKQFLWDVKPDNFAVIKDAKGEWVPFLLDKGAVVPFSEMNGGQIGSDTHSNLDKFTAQFSAILSDAGMSDARITADPTKYLSDTLPAEVPSFTNDFRAIQENYARALNPPPAKQPLPKENEKVTLWKVMREKYMPVTVIGLVVAVVVAFFSIPVAIALATAGFTALAIGAHSEAQERNTLTQQVQNSVALDSEARQKARAQTIAELTAGQEQNRPSAYFADKAQVLNPALQVR